MRDNILKDVYAQDKVELSAMDVELGTYDDVKKYLIEDNRGAMKAIDLANSAKKPAEDSLRLNKELLNKMEPFLTGGSMIENVTMQSATFAKAPQRFEAGVPNMAQAIGMAAGLNYLSKIGLPKIHTHELALTKYALEQMNGIAGLNIIGPNNLEDRGGVISFTLDGIHPHDVGQALDQYGIAVRTGHHCAWPLMRALNVVATTRASFYLYNDISDVDALVAGILKAQLFFNPPKKSA